MTFYGVCVWVERKRQRDKEGERKREGERERRVDRKTLRLEPITSKTLIQRL